MGGGAALAEWEAGNVAFALFFEEPCVYLINFPKYFGTNQPQNIIFFLTFF
jgi:hypothetical protein